MIKFLVLGAFLWLEVSGQISVRNDATVMVQPVTPDGETTTVFPTTAAVDIGKQFPVDANGRYNFNADHQSFYVNGPLIIQRPEEKHEEENEKEIRSDYKVTKGIGAHKVHVQKLAWNRARRICHEEGAYLAIIRSAAEEKVIQRMLHEQKVATAWIGFHDQFEEGDWISVLDEPLATIGWDAWANLGHPNPDNAGGRENCAEYRRDANGINDAFCGAQLAFVCKISV